MKEPLLSCTNLHILDRRDGACGVTDATACERIEGDALPIQLGQSLLCHVFSGLIFQSVLLFWQCLGYARNVSNPIFRPFDFSTFKKLFGSASLSV